MAKMLTVARAVALLTLAAGTVIGLSSPLLAQVGMGAQALVLGMAMAGSGFAAWAGLEWTDQ